MELTHQQRLERDNIIRMRNMLESYMSCHVHVAEQVPGESAQCAVCDERLGWWCPDSPDHICHYDNGDMDQCDWCGQPEERL